MMHPPLCRPVSFSCASAIGLPPRLFSFSSLRVPFFSPASSLLFSPSPPCFTHTPSLLPPALALSVMGAMMIIIVGLAYTAYKSHRRAAESSKLSENSFKTRYARGCSPSSPPASPVPGFINACCHTPLPCACQRRAGPLAAKSGVGSHYRRSGQFVGHLTGGSAGVCQTYIWRAVRRGIGRATAPAPFGAAHVGTSHAADEVYEPRVQRQRRGRQRSLQWNRRRARHVQPGACNERKGLATARPAVRVSRLCPPLGVVGNQPTRGCSCVHTRPCFSDPPGAQERHEQAAALQQQVCSCATRGEVALTPDPHQDTLWHAARKPCRPFLPA